MFGDDNDRPYVVCGRFTGRTTIDGDLAELDCDVGRYPPLFTSRDEVVGTWTSRD